MKNLISLAGFKFTISYNTACFLGLLIQCMYRTI